MGNSGHSVRLDFGGPKITAELGMFLAKLTHKIHIICIEVILFSINACICTCNFVLNTLMQLPINVNSVAIHGSQIKVTCLYALTGSHHDCHL